MHTSKRLCLMCRISISFLKEFVRNFYEYHLAGKFGKFGESSMIHQNKHPN